MKSTRSGSSPHAVLQVKKFNDLHRVKVDDVTFMETGNVGMYIAKSKTDRECLGVEFDISGEMVGVFSVPVMLGNGELFVP